LTKKILIKELKIKDIASNYINWMNDENIIKYTEIDKKQNKKTIKSYVSNKLKSKFEFLYGIYLVDKKKEIKSHIGNIKLGPINFKHKYAEISYFIGEKKYWKNGYGTEAIRQLILIAKKKFQLKKLQAGFNQLNKGSEKVLLKNNFKLEAIFKSQRVFKNKRVDSYWYGKII
jgi:RimJ/RimL family protein N-acetyltransferase